MSCGRKYVSWRNGAPRVPIASIRYFVSILTELEEQPAPAADYWDYVRERIERMDKLWRNDQRSDNPPDGNRSESEIKHRSGG
jgi:hypothetical protein